MQQATEPQSIGGVLDRGFSLFRACFASTAVLAFASAIISAPVNRITTGVGAAPSLGPSLAAALGVIVILVLSLMFYGAILARIGAVARGESLSIGGALRIGLRRGPYLFGAGVCYTLVVMVGLVLLIVPGIWLMVALLFGFYAVVLDGKGPISSLYYSHDLVRGHWWRTTIVLTVIFFVVFILYLIVGIIAGVAALFDPAANIEAGVLPWYVDFLVVPLFTAVLVPLTYSMFYSVYRDLQLRHEGSDLADRIAAAAE